MLPVVVVLCSRDRSPNNSNKYDDSKYVEDTESVAPESCWLVRMAVVAALVDDEVTRHQQYSPHQQPVASEVETPVAALPMKFLSTLLAFWRSCWNTLWQIRRTTRCQDLARKKHHFGFTKQPLSLFCCLRHSKGIYRCCSNQRGKCCRSSTRRERGAASWPLGK